MHRRSIAPFCRDDGPQTDPTIRLPATWRHSGLTKVSITESHGEARKESLKFIPSHSAALRCVHALALPRGRTENVARHDNSSVGVSARSSNQDDPHRSKIIL